MNILDPLGVVGAIVIRTVIDIRQSPLFFCFAMRKDIKRKVSLLLGICLTGKNKNKVKTMPLRSKLYRTTRGTVGVVKLRNDSCRKRSKN